MTSVRTAQHTLGLHVFPAAPHLLAPVVVGHLTYDKDPFEAVIVPPASQPARALVGTSLPSPLRGAPAPLPSALRSAPLPFQGRSRDSQSLMSTAIAIAASPLLGVTDTIKCTIPTIQLDQF